MNIPKSLAACADRLYKLKAMKSDLAAKVKAVDDERIAIEAHLIDHMAKDQTGVQGKTARVSLIVKPVPQVEDWGKLRKFIVKNGEWEMLNKSIKSAYIMEVLEDGKKIPGITTFDKVTISLNKV